MTFSVIIPAFNEARAIGDVLRELTAFVQARNLQADVIVVDDGSTDGTAEAAEHVPGVRVLRHPYNKGYGAALKTGIAAAGTEWCITYDADGQHAPELLPALLEHCREPNHMVVGKREQYRGPWIRRPGKFLLALVANNLTRHRIPDLNSGLRAFRREEFLRYRHLFPSGFSLSTTSTICFFRAGLNVVYVPVVIRQRVGKSTVQMRDGPRTLMLILRLIMLFSPLRIFLPASVFFGCLTLVDMLYEISSTGHFLVSKGMIALISLTSLVFFFGLLADQIAAIRREIGGHTAAS